jgi:hypothetical protein
VAASLQQSWLMSLAIVVLSVEPATPCIIGQGASTARTPAMPWKETPRLTKQTTTRRRRRTPALWPIFLGNVRSASQVSGSGERPLTSSRPSGRPNWFGSGRGIGLQARASQLPPGQSDGCHSRRSYFRQSEGSSPAASRRRAARSRPRAKNRNIGICAQGDGLSLPGVSVVVLPVPPALRSHEQIQVSAERNFLWIPDRSVTARCLACRPRAVS